MLPVLSHDFDFQCHILNIEYVGDIAIPTQVIKYNKCCSRRISQSDCSIYIKTLSFFEVLWIKVSVCSVHSRSGRGETSWKKRSSRREDKQICMFYKLNVGNFLEFLCDLIPLSFGETNNYNLRNRHNISQTTL
jgi:hypothetical protein